jgi:hypothetical protein
MSEQVLGHVFDGGEIGRSVIGPNPTFIIAEDHVHNPVQAVLDGPMAAHHRPEEVRHHDQRGDIKACFRLGFSTDLAAASTMTTAFRPGQPWRSCSQSTSWMTVVVLVSMRP